jgi:hypothetical protein
VAGGRRALVVATYDYRDEGLRGLTAPAHDAEALAGVLSDPGIAGFDVTVLVNEPAHVVGEAIADFYRTCRREDLTLLYFSGHGLKDDEGRLYLAMTNTRREALLFTGLPAGTLNDAMEASPSRRKLLILDCCYSGAFPPGRGTKSDAAVHTLERFQGKGRAVLTASDATQYAFEGDAVSGSGTPSVFTRYLVEAMRTGAADLDGDGDIALDELYSWVYDRVVAEVPQQRPKKQQDVDGRIVIARNVNWSLPAHLRHAIDSPISAQRLAAVEGLADLHRRGNEAVQGAVEAELARLADDDSRSVSAAATALLAILASDQVQPAPAPAAGPASPPAPAPAPAPAVAPAPPPAVAPAPPPAAAEEPAVVAGRSWLRWVLGLVLLSAVPLTLARTLPFEAPSEQTADVFAESTVPWTLFVVLPLTACVVLLAVSDRSPRLLPPAAGLLVGAALALVETVLFWISFFVYYRESYLAGSALWALIAGTAVVATAAVVALVGSPLRARPSMFRDWRLVCAAAVLTSLVIAVAAWPDDPDLSLWLQRNSSVLVLGPAGLALTLLRLRDGLRTAGLVAVAVLALWTAYFPLRELAAPALGTPASVSVAEVVCAVVVLAACCVAQLVPQVRREEPAAAAPARR